MGVANTSSPYQDFCSEHQEGTGDFSCSCSEQGCSVVLCSLRASICDGQGGPIPSRGWGYCAISDAGAGMVKPLQTCVAKQGRATSMAQAWHRRYYQGVV